MYIYNISEYYLGKQVNIYVTILGSLSAAKKAATKNSYYDTSSTINIKSQTGELLAQKIGGKW